MWRSEAAIAPGTIVQAAAAPAIFRKSLRCMAELLADVIGAMPSVEPVDYSVGGLIPPNLRRLEGRGHMAGDFNLVLLLCT